MAQDHDQPHTKPVGGEFNAAHLGNVLGVKGVGELGIIGATPAVVNAVVDALADAGLGRDAERVQMPLTAPTVWRALQRDFDVVAIG